MRVSIKQKDKGFVKNPQCYNVYLDDVLCNRCVTADTKLNYIVVEHVENRVCVREEIIYGKVKIKKIKQ